MIAIEKLCIFHNFVHSTFGDDDKETRRGGDDDSRGAAADRMANEKGERNGIERALRKNVPGLGNEGGGGGGLVS